MSGVELPPPPLVVAHRGASGERLENTVEACLLAVEAGAPMLEIDVQLAADDELVVFHDQDLARLGGADFDIRLREHYIRAMAEGIAEAVNTVTERDVQELGVQQAFEKLTGAIHIYGGDFFAVPRSEWDAETLAERAWSVQGAIKLFEQSNDRFFGFKGPNCAK